MNLYRIISKVHVIKMSLILVSAIYKSFQWKTAIKWRTTMSVQYSMQLDASKAEKLPT